MAIRTVPAPTGGDDQTLVQNVFDAAQAGDEIVFPAGNPDYRHSGKLVLQNKPDVYLHAADNGQFTLTATNVNACSIHIWSNSHRLHVKGMRARTLGANQRLNNGFQNAGIIIDYADDVWTEDCISQGAPGLGWYLFNANNGKHDRPQVLNSGADGIHLTYGSSGNVITDAWLNDVGDDFIPEIGYQNDGEVGRPHNNTWIRPVGRNGHARGSAFAGAYGSRVVDPDFTDTRAASVMFACERGDFNTMPTTDCRVTGGKARRSQIPKPVLGSTTNDSPVHAGPILFASALANTGVVDCIVDGLSVGDFTSNTNAVAQQSGAQPAGTSGIVNLKMYQGTPTQLWQGTPVGSSATWSDMRTQTMAPTATAPVTGGGTTPAATASPVALFDAPSRTSTTTPGSPDVGPAWTAARGTWGASTAGLYSVSNVDDDQLIVDLGSTQQQAGALITTGGNANSYPEVLLRWESATSHYWVEGAPNGSVVITRRLGTNFNALASSAAGTWSTGKRLDARVVDLPNGSARITAYVDGVQVASYDDANTSRPMGTSIGLRNGIANTGTSIRFGRIHAAALGHPGTNQRAAFAVPSGSTSASIVLPIAPVVGRQVMVIMAFDGDPGVVTSDDGYAVDMWRSPSVTMGVLRALRLPELTGSWSLRVTWPTAAGMHAHLIEIAAPWYGAAARAGRTSTSSDTARSTWDSDTQAPLDVPVLAISALVIDSSAAAFTAAGDPQWASNQTREYSARNVPSTGLQSLDVVTRVVAAGANYGTVTSHGTADQGQFLTYAYTQQNGATAASSATGTSTATGTVSSGGEAALPTARQTGMGVTATKSLTTVQATLPAAPTAGNLLVTSLSVDKTAASIVAPSGFTLSGVWNGTAGTALAMAWKVATGSETGPVVWNWSGANGAATIVAEYPLKNAALPSAAVVVGTESNVNGLSASSPSTATGGLRVAIAAIDSAGGAISPASWPQTGPTWSNATQQALQMGTPADFSYDNGSSSLSMASAVSSAGADSTVSYSYSGTADQQALIAAAFTGTTTAGATGAGTSSGVGTSAASGVARITATAASTAEGADAAFSPTWNARGAATSSAAGTSAALPPVRPVTDRWNSVAEKPANWSTQDRLGGAVFDFDRADGEARITLAASPTKDQNATARNAASVAQPSQGDLDVAFPILSEMLTGTVFSGIGIVAYDAARDRFVTLYYFNNPANQQPQTQFAYANTASSWTIFTNMTNLVNTVPVSLRLRRVGNQWSVFTAEDGATWLQFGSTQTITGFDQTQVGWFAIGGQGGAFTSRIGAFRNLMDQTATGAATATGVGASTASANPAPATTAGQVGVGTSSASGVARPTATVATTGVGASATSGARPTATTTVTGTGVGTSTTTGRPAAASTAPATATGTSVATGRIQAASAASSTATGTSAGAQTTIYQATPSTGVGTSTATGRATATGAALSTATGASTALGYTGGTTGSSATGASAAGGNPAIGGIGGQAITISDPFDRVAADLGPNWEVLFPGWSTDGSAAISDAASSTPAAIHTMSLGSADHRVSALVGSGGNAGVLARYVDASNYYGARRSSTNIMQVFRVVNGNSTVLSGQASNWGATSVLTLVCEGTALIVLKDGVEAFRVADTSAGRPMGTRVGMRGSNATIRQFGASSTAASAGQNPVRADSPSEGTGTAVGAAGFAGSTTSSAVGTEVASGAPALTSAAPSSATGTSTAVSTATTTSATAAATATGTSTAAGYSDGQGGATSTAAGTSATTGTPALAGTALAAAAGTSSASGVTGGTVAATSTAVGTGTAVAQAPTFRTDTTSSAVGTSTATGRPTTTGSAASSATGMSLGAGATVGSSAATSLGSSASTANGVAAFTGTATSTAWGQPSTTTTMAATQAVTSQATGTTAVAVVAVSITRAATSTAAGTSTATAVVAITATATDTADGTSTAQAAVISATTTTSTGVGTSTAVAGVARTAGQATTLALAATVATAVGLRVAGQAAHAGTGGSGAQGAGSLLRAPVALNADGQWVAVLVLTEDGAWSAAPMRTLQ